MVTLQICFEPNNKSQTKLKTETFTGINYPMARKEFKKKYPKGKVVTEQVISKNSLEEA